MIMRRIALAAAALLCSGVLAASAASAQEADDDDYTALCNPLTVSDTSPAPGDTITVSGTTATANAQFVVLLDGEVIGEGVSGPDRTFTIDVVIPEDANSILQVIQLGDNTDPVVGCPASLANLDILAGTLVRTGASDSTLPLARIGAGLVAGGGLLVLVARRRRHSTAPA